MIETMAEGGLANHSVVSQSEWLEARRELLVKEKALSRQTDEVSRLRRELPWVAVEKPYVFESSEGLESLSDLFGKNSQLITYHFMFGPDWEEGCTGCSFLADHIDGANLHLAHHDVSVVVVSRGPIAKLQEFRKRMGWKFKWVSSLESEFNFDFGVSYTRDELDKGEVMHNFKMQKLRSEEQPGTSVFYKDEAGKVFHTYSSYERGGDILIGADNYLDLTPKGRNEESTLSWIRMHDQYEVN